MPKHRIRIRFRKEDDLRWISHRDLARTMERACRRAELPLAATQGFHPKAKLSFPNALGLGIAGANEVLEIELTHEISADEIVARLATHLPPGLAVNSAQILDQDEKKGQVDRLLYEISVPPSRRSDTQLAIQELLAQPSSFIQREVGPAIDVCATLECLQLAGGVLRFGLSATRTAGVRPREVLDALGLSDLEGEGYRLTRTTVEISPPRQKRNNYHEKGNAD